MYMNSFKAPGIINFIFPENLYCACCGDSIDRRTRIHSLCDSCIKKISWISDNPYASSMDDLAFDELYSCCIYGYYPRQMIQKLKFRGEGYLARPMSKLMAERVLLSFGNDREKVRSAFDCICCIPSAKEKQLERGYNQAKLLAVFTAKELGMPFEELLTKPEETPSVRLAGRWERQAILEGAFRISKNASSLIGQRVLLVDDVLTTGSTANEAALTLKAAGCSRVDVLVFACANGMAVKK